MCATADGRLRIASLVEESIVDGPGLRFVVFTQGCPHHCPGCHNPETHDMSGGRMESIERIVAMYRENPLLSGITFSGGEPFLQAGPLALLAEEIHSLGGDVITYTGFWFDELLQRDGDVQKLLDATDLLIDGPYMESLRSLDLLFRGSSNQRLLNRSARKALSLAIKNFAA